MNLKYVMLEGPDRVLIEVFEKSFHAASFRDQPCRNFIMIEDKRSLIMVHPTKAYFDS